jgi:protein-disulfide isomerase
MNKKTIMISAISIVIGVLITLGATKLNLGGKQADSDVIFGNKNAPVELIEYASLGCGHCAHFHRESFPKIKAELIDTGKVRYVFKAFPGNQTTLQGAMLIHCASNKNREQLMSSLFVNQRSWLNGSTVSELKAIAADAGIDNEEFYSCIENKELADRIVDNKKEASEKYNIRGTPSFVINGEKLEIANSAEDIIAAVIDASDGKSPNQGFKEKAAIALQVSDTDKFIGKKDAPVTIIEYASLSCPHCAKFHTETFPQLKKEFIDTGKAILVYRNFPLNEPALKAATLAECAGSDRYFDALEKLFATQEKWAFDKNNLLKNLAVAGRDFGINQFDFDSCFTNKDIENKLLESRMKATSELGVSGTPVFFVNGKKGDHLHSIEEFRKAIEEANVR